MRTVIVSCANVRTSSQLVDRIAGMLDLPPHCGKSLDSLADCLWEVPVPLKVVLAGLDANAAIDPAWAGRLKAMFSQAARDIDGLSFSTL